MKIIFSVLNTGLGNNGGSKTIIESANTLVNLGHEVYILDSGKSMYTWGPIKAQHIKLKTKRDIPDVDVIVSTGFKSVRATVRLPKRCGKQFTYIRGWELWKMSVQQIIEEVLKAPTIKIVNSIGLQQKLKSLGFESYIIRPGNDFNSIYPMVSRTPNVVLGGLYHTKHKTKRSGWIIHTAKALKSKYTNIQLWMFGADSDPNIPVIDKYLYQPNKIKKASFYNGITVWLAPSELEGLHIPPQEAMLAECVVVTTDAPLSGTSDYISHEKTGLVAKNDIFSFVAQVERLIRDPLLRSKISKNGRKMIIDLGSRETNMQKMVKLFEEFI